MLNAAATVRYLGFAVFACLLLAGASSGTQAAGALAFVGVNVIPMDSERVLTRHAVIIQGDRIIAVDPADDASLPRGTRRIDARGKYLIPGLIDAHARLLSDRQVAPQYRDDELAMLVTHGVTTLRHAGGDPELLRLRDRIAAEDLVAPMLYVSTPRLASLVRPGDGAGRMVQTPFEAAAAVRAWREEGYDFVGTAYGNTAEVWQGIVLTARGSRMPLVGRVPAAVSLRQALESGQQIEYLDSYLEALSGTAPGSGGLSGSGIWESEGWGTLANIDERRVDEVVQATIDAGTWNVPMLAALRTAVGGNPRGDDSAAADPAAVVSASVREALRQEAAQLGARLPEEALRRRFLALRDALVRELAGAGGKLMAGSGDPLWSRPYGLGLQDEIVALAAAGMPPWAALRAATAGPAEFLNFRGGGRAEYATVDEGGIRFTPTSTAEVDFGLVDVGMRADLVLLAGNPLDDLNNLARVEGVVLRGRWLPRDELDAIRERAAASLGQAPLRQPAGLGVGARDAPASGSSTPARHH